MIHKVKAFYDDDLAGKTFALWGLAFKPDTDDIREAPSLYMIRELLLAGAKVRAFDPEAMENVRGLHGDAIYYADNMYDALVFRNPDFDKVSEGLNEKVLFDGRNLFETEKMQELGYHYESIGREKITK
mgnify:CR=1 FL=1